MPVPEAIENTGLPLPLFIKGTLSTRCGRWARLPHGDPAGCGYLAHAVDGQERRHRLTAYFHIRNRLILAALHSPRTCTRIDQEIKPTLRHLLSMEYSTVAVQLRAIEDFLTGPEHLFGSLRTALPEVRELRKNYDDAKTLPSAREVPPPSADPVMAEGLLKPPVNPAVIALRASKALLHNLKEPEKEAAERPQLNVPAAAARWFLLGNLDSATVSNADGSGVAFRRRDPEEFRRLGLRALATYKKLGQQWGRMRAAYRSALPELTSAESWKQVFDQK